MKSSRPKTSNEIISDIENYYQMYNDTRHFFPYIDDSFIGNCEIKCRSFAIIFNTPITKEIQKSINSTAHFHNQNFLVRLYAILQSNGIYDNLDKKYSKLKILKDLRNRFAHSISKYNSLKKDHNDLMKQIIEEFDLEEKVYDDFPISRDTVIDEIVLEAIKCVKDDSQISKNI